MKQRFTQKLNLGVSDTWKSDVYLKRVNNPIFKLCRVFSNSITNIKILKSQEESFLNLDQHFGLLTPIDVRWVSKFSAANRITSIKIFPVLITALFQMKAEYFSLIVELKNLGILGHLHIPIISNLRESFIFNNIIPKIRSSN